MNPEVIAWLRSPEGEAWSRSRIYAAQKQALLELHGGGGNMHAPARMGTVWHNDGNYVLGLFSMKEG